MKHYVYWIGRLNEWVGRAAGLLIVAVVLIIIQEVVARGLFNAPSLWADESMTYLAGMAYALGGGYTLLHRKHVLVDLAYDPIAKRGGSLKRAVDVAGFAIFAIYCLTLVYFGWDMAVTSIEQHEGSGTLWNPALWPVKLTIPIAGLLLFMQGLANLLVDLGLTPAPALEQSHGR
jgi:TRAP-type mannitol/chloroaromatic compound transport system permease small subunit